MAKANKPSAGAKPRNRKPAGKPSGKPAQRPRKPAGAEAAKPAGYNKPSHTKRPSAAVIRRKREAGLKLVKLTSPDGKRHRYVFRPAGSSPAFGRFGTVQTGKHAGAAERASALVCTDGDGNPIGRARIGTAQIALAARKLRRGESPRAALTAIFGGKPAAAFRAAVAYADGRSGIDAEARKRLQSRQPGPTESPRHVTGKAFVAALVGLADPAKLPADALGDRPKRKRAAKPKRATAKPKRATAKPKPSAEPKPKRATAKRGKRA